MERKWENLPKDILHMIAKRLLTNETDNLRFRAVCSSWRSSIPRSENSPFRISFIKPNGSNSPPFVLTQRNLLLISPLDNDVNTDSLTPWVVKVVETGSHKLSLLDPCSGLYTSYFPKSADELPDLINFLDYKVTVIDRVYNLDSCGRPDSAFDYPSVGRAIVVTDGKIEGNECFVVLTPYGDEKLSIWKPGMETWIPIIHEYGGFSKIIRYKDQICAVNYGRRLMALIDLETFEVTQNVSLPSNTGPYIAEFNGHLYMMSYSLLTEALFIMPFIDVSVYVLNVDKATWEPTKDLGGGVFFVCNEIMFCVSAEGLGLPKGNFFYIDGFYWYNHEVDCEVSCSLVYEMPSGKTYIKNWWPNRPPFWPPPLKR